MEGASQRAAFGTATLGRDRASAVAAAVDEGADPTLAIAHQQDRNTADVEREIALRPVEIGRECHERGLPAKDTEAFALEMLALCEVSCREWEGTRREVGRPALEVYQEAPDTIQFSRALQGETLLSAIVAPERSPRQRFGPAVWDPSCH